MATHKVIQDIEAEDKFLGPLTLKQFIFGAIGAFFGWLNFFAIAKGFPLALIVFVPPMLLGFFLAIPWSKDQPTEVWVLAKLRFRFKPKKRIWSQDGMVNLVTITAPKRVEKPLTNNLSQIEVTSRLKALADTIDSRGWAIKNADLDAALRPTTQSDRLITPESFTAEVPIVDASNTEDMFDNSAISHTFDQMIEQKTQQSRQQNLDKLDMLREGLPLSSVNQPQPQFTPPIENTMRPTKAANISDDEENTILHKLEENKESTEQAYGHMHGIKRKKKKSKHHQKDTDKEKAGLPLENSPLTGRASIALAPTPAIMNLAQNDDLNVATIARQAKKDKGHDDEVVVSLR